MASNPSAYDIRSATDAQVRWRVAAEMSTRAPSGGIPDQIELLWHWERFTAADRKRLLQLARQLGRTAPHPSESSPPEFKGSGAYGP
jgi:uncharacterized membrane protein YccC